MNSFSSHMGNRRNLLGMNSYASVHYPTSTFCTDAQTKSDKMKHTIEENLLKNLHHLPDPLKKNLADSVITGERKNTMETMASKTHVVVTPQTTQRTDNYPSLSGITGFFSGVFKVMGTIFQKRASSPASQYFDCFDTEYEDGQMAPQMFWQASNFEFQNKNDCDQLGSTNDSRTNLEVEMNVECKTAAAQCEEKLNEVRRLLSTKPVQNVQKPRSPRRPKKAFVEAGSVEENFEDAFSESVSSLANDNFVECCSPFNVHDDVLIQSDAPKAKTDICESMDIMKNIPELPEPPIVEVKENPDMEKLSNDNLSMTKTNNEVISSCEDKLNKLKELLQSRHSKKSKTTEPAPTTTENKIDTVFANEIDTSDLNNSHDSDNFNEVTGRFSSSVDSEDSFQIVFSDSPQLCRRRIPSECESEDSFIVFEESPDSCYTSNEVFGEEILENDSSDSESECESDSDVDDDSGCGTQCKLTPNMSRTFGNLTDDSLYDQDVVDCAAVSSPCTKQSLEGSSSKSDEVGKEKETKPQRRVHFSTEPPKVHVMRVWAFAARQARAGNWERYALDRERFRRRIADVEMAISWVLKNQHRTRVMFQRFTPWWNAQRRKELAEKKEAEEKEKELAKKNEAEENEKRRIEEDSKNNDSDETLNSCDNSVPELIEDNKNDSHHVKDETKILDNSTEVIKSIEDNETDKVEVSQSNVNIDNEILSQNNRDQNANCQVNDDNQKVDKVNQVNDSIIPKISEVPSKNGLLIKNCCMDT